MLLSIPEMVEIAKVEARPKLGITTEFIVALWLVESGNRGKDGVWRCNSRAKGDYDHSMKLWRAIGLAQFHAATWNDLSWGKWTCPLNSIGLRSRECERCTARATVLYAKRGRHLLLKARLPVTPEYLDFHHQHGHAPDAEERARIKAGKTRAAKLRWIMKLLQKEMKHG